MKNCFDEGTIQAFLDGELASDLSENVARHVAVCDECARLMGEAEDETAFAFSALEQEFNTLVPTQRLWTKINDSIGKEKKSVWQTVYAFIANPTVGAFAALLIVFGLFASILSLQNNDSVDSIAQTEPYNQIKENAVAPVVSNAGQFERALSRNESENSQPAQIKQSKKEFQIVKTSFAKKENSPKPNDQQVIQTPDVNSVDINRQSTDNNLSGEDSYIKTIATLEKTVNNRKDEVLKPSSRFAFEKDLAVVNDAINRMKEEVEKNPKNEAAKNVLRASYQNKIDLLNSVTEKTELMASLKD